MFRGRRLLIATKHGKEQVLAPLLERQLGVICVTDTGFDTDILGTFSGEVERILDPVAAVREKCRLAAAAAGCDLVVGSEGSFGPHPLMPFLHAHEEWLMLLDLSQQLEITARELSTDTNFSARAVPNLEILEAFASEVGFPAHALIMRKAEGSMDGLTKGIQDMHQLHQLYHDLMSRFGSVYVETDMRALYNPRRMQVIKKAGRQLLHKIQSCCPACGMPGFDVAEVRRGLACALCGAATRTTLSHLYRCRHCTHTHEQWFPQGKKKEDPMYCDRCNP